MQRDRKFNGRACPEKKKQNGKIRDVKEEADHFTPSLFIRPDTKRFWGFNINNTPRSMFIRVRLLTEIVQDIIT